MMLGILRTITNETSMKIEFYTEDFDEDDCRWSALFVRVDNSRWKMAKPLFNTEDQVEIRKTLEEDVSGSWRKHFL